MLGFVSVGLLVIAVSCDRPGETTFVDASAIAEAYGRTMGTTYMVKVAAADVGKLPDDWKFQLDAELRRVNDQMSTYLASSELSRFNRGPAETPFEVSPETVEVVAFARQVSEKTEGAFDVTVGPLVNLWSFGPSERNRELPDTAQIAEQVARVGYEKVDFERGPPRLRKSQADVEVDLSAIAKGHGVDRLVRLLQGMGVQNAFVEIGGEVRVIGTRGDRRWGVGIQRPDDASQAVMIALPLRDAAVATSGDYRNFFTIDGKRYSHTIDPRTGRPVEHTLASVSVLAPTCMEADAWATALNVLGPERGAELAAQEGLEVLMVLRTGGELKTVATGRFEEVVSEPKARANE